MTSEPVTSLAEELPANSVIPAQPDQDKARDPRQLLDELRERFEVFRTFQPLAIGIDKAIRSRLPEADRKTLRVALSMHTHCNRYLRLLAKATQRFDLDGAPVAEVSDEHRQFASTVLEERAQRRATNGEAKAPADQRPKRAHARKPDHHTKPGSHTKPDNPTDNPNPTNGATPTPAAPKKAESAKSPEKRRHAKPAPKKHKIETAPNGASPDKIESPAIQATFAEKLILLSEKFGRK